jgi:hypothetical protein
MTLTVGLMQKRALLPSDDSVSAGDSLEIAEVIATKSVIDEL